MNNGNESGIQKKYLTSDIIVLVIILVILGILTFLSFFGKVISKDKLTITANLSIVNENTWKMRGRVIFDNGVPVDSARVWIILKGKGGNDDSPPTGYTKKDGEFDFDSLPIYVGVTTPKQAQSLNKSYNPKRVASPKKDAEGDTSPGEVARGDTSSSEYRDRVKEVNVNVYLPDEDIKGEKKIMLEGSGFSPDQITPWHLVLLIMIFLISIVVPFLKVSPRLKHSLSLILAFMFTIGLILFIWVGISYVSDFQEDDVLLVGIGNIYKGHYDKGIEEDWLFSLTAPKGKDGTPGFGVPLWVLLLSVVGASLFTVSIIVSEIKKRPNFDKLGKDPPDEKEREKFREKLENIVRHQFYMLFSPLGAIFIYQLLIMAKAADQPVTVAIAALGAGSTINILLDKAVSASRRAMGKLTEE